MIWHIYYRSKCSAGFPAVITFVFIYNTVYIVFWHIFYFWYYLSEVFLIDMKIIKKKKAENWYTNQWICFVFFFSFFFIYFHFLIVACLFCQKNYHVCYYYHYWLLLLLLPPFIIVTIARAVQLSSLSWNSATCCIFFVFCDFVYI